MENFLNTDLSRADLADLLAEVGRRLAVVTEVAASASPKGHEAAGDLQLLDAGEVSKLCRLPVARVYEMQRRGQIGSVRDGRTVRFTRGQVAAFVKARARAPR